MQVESKIDTKTSIPLFAALASLPILVGIILWLANIEAKAEKNKSDIEEIKPLLQSTHDAVIRIEERMKRRER